MSVWQGIVLAIAGAGYIYFFRKAAKAFGEVVSTQLEINDTLEDIRIARAQIAALGEQDDE